MVNFNLNAYINSESISIINIYASTKVLVIIEYYKLYYQKIVKEL